MKTTCCFAVFLLCLGIISSGANEFKSVNTGDKIKHKDLTFAVTFDNKGTTAEHAAGEKVSSLGTLDLGLRGTVGFDLQQGFTPAGNEELFYVADKNISPREGTVSLWIAAPDYAPSETLTDGKQRGNIALFEADFIQPEKHITFRLFEYKDVVSFDCRDILKDVGTPPINSVRRNIRKGEWHQFVMTWDHQQIRLYLNGELQGTTTVTYEYAKFFEDPGWDMKKSHFGIPLKVWGEPRKFRVLFDDMKVYRRALTPTEIQRQYLELETAKSDRTPSLLDVALYGVDKTEDTMEAELDMVSLPERYAEQLNQGNLMLSYTVEGPDGLTQQGSFKPARVKDYIRLKGLNRIGYYTLKVYIQDQEKPVPSGTASVERPDLSFIGNRYGITDKVPQPFTPLSMQDDVIQIWNRKYFFGAGPFPEKILVNGENLLVSPPELILELMPGEKTPLQFQSTKRSFTQREAVLEGNASFGSGMQYTITYRTTVAYDGMIKTDWSISGKPLLHSMRLEWQQYQKSAQYLMTPQLHEADVPLAAPYSLISFQRPIMIWFTSEKHGGFAYTTESDANWIYPDKYPVLKADPKTGKAVVTMIAEKTAMPEDTPYQSLFIATPTRPRHPQARYLRLGLRYFGNKRINCCSELPLMFCFGAVPGKSYALDSEWYGIRNENLPPMTEAIYGGANMLTTADKVGMFFAKDYEVPGAYTYSFDEPYYDPQTQTEKIIKTQSIGACNSSSINDYFLWNQYQYIHGTHSDKIWGVYYDLADATTCSNPRHGCKFTDKFGRTILRRSILSKRSLFERTLTLMREKGKILFLHAQREFIPFMHGFGDYWYPGEQNNGLMLANRNCYLEDINDVIWTSEYNSDVLGVNVVLLGAGHGDAWRPEVSEQLFGQCLLHNIEFDSAWMKDEILNKIWDCCEDYQIGESTFHRYDSQKEIVSSDPELKISYYTLKNGKDFLVVLMNRMPYEIKAGVDFNKLGITNAKAVDAYRDKEYVIQNGKLEHTFPPRNFILLAIPPKPFYPFVNRGSRNLGFWKPGNSKCKLIYEIGADPAVPLRGIQFEADTPDDGGCCIVKVPAQPGKRYTMKIRARGVNTNANSKIHLLFVGQEKTQNIATMEGTVTAPLTDEWKEYVYQTTVPSVTPWDKIAQFQVTVCAKNLKAGKLLFDEIVIEEAD